MTLYTIPGATLLNQLSAPTTDGAPDENARENCVPTSLACGLRPLTGRVYEPDQLKDAVYGQGYTGTQAAAHYVAYCAAQGVRLASYNGAQSALVAELHAQISAGHPCLVTMPSNWGTAPADPVHPSGYTHVGCAVGCADGVIEVMNPWGGFWQTETDEWWAARLCYGQIWILSLESSASVPTGPTGGATMWKDAGNGVAVDSRGVRAEHAMATYLLAHPSLGDVVAGWTSGETYYDGTHSMLPLEGDTVLQWDTARGSVAEMGGEVAVALYNQAQSAKATATAAQMANAALTANKADLLNQITALQQRVTAAEAAAQAAQAAEQTAQQQAQEAQQAAQAAQAAAQAAPAPAQPPVSAPVIAPQAAIDALVRAIYSQARVDYEKSRKP